MGDESRGGGKAPDLDHGESVHTQETTALNESDERRRRKRRYARGRYRSARVLPLQPGKRVISPVC